MELVKQGHYQLACGRYFEAKHKSDTKFAPQHPNQYYDESRKLLAEDREGRFEFIFAVQLTLNLNKQWK